MSCSVGADAVSGGGGETRRMVLGRSKSDNLECRRGIPTVEAGDAGGISTTSSGFSACSVATWEELELLRGSRWREARRDRQLAFEASERMEELLERRESIGICSTTHSVVSESTDTGSSLTYRRNPPTPPRSWHSSRS